MVIEYLRFQTQNTAVAYYYFNYAQQEECGLGTVLSSLVKQLLYQLKPKQFAELGIVEMYRQYQNVGRQLTIEDLVALIRIAVGYFTYTYLILDGLDECDRDTTRREILPFLTSAGSDLGPALVFVTSRPHPEDLQEAFGQADKIPIQAHDEDLVCYIREVMHASPRMKKWIAQSKDWENKILSDLTTAACGMSVSNLYPALLFANEKQFFTRTLPRQATM